MESIDPSWLCNLVATLALAIDDQVAAATEEVAEHGASMPAALVTLRAEPGLSIEQLRIALRLTHSGGARLVDRLVELGLLDRAAGFGRRVSLELTPSGLALAERILQAREGAVERALEPLADREREQLATLLARMLRGMVSSEARSWEICRLCDTHACPPERCPVELELSLETA